MIAAHIRVDPSRGASIRLAELDPARRLVRELGTTEMSLSELYEGGVPTPDGNPLGRACERAQALGEAARSRSGRPLSYAAWVDVV